MYRVTSLDGARSPLAPTPLDTNHTAKQPRCLSLYSASPFRFDGLTRRLWRMDIASFMSTTSSLKRRKKERKMKKMKEDKWEGRDGGKAPFGRRGRRPTARARPPTAYPLD